MSKKKYYRFSQAARFLKTSPDVVARWIMRGFLTAVRREDGTILVSEHELKTFAASRRRLERGVRLSCLFSPLGSMPAAHHTRKGAA